MSLLKIWKKQPDEVLGLSIQQVLAMAGNGKLTDGSPCSNEIRQFLKEVPSKFLVAGARYCLENAFTDSGLILQDCINEMGRRLEFKVEHGLYRGTKSKTGFDGIWKAPNCRDMIIEVKTTDYINLPIKKLFEYRRSLAAAKSVDQDACVLIVLGREDAGSLEDQVRGSRYGWDTRLISVDGLIKLLAVKEMADKETTVAQIRALLQPIETTKLDAIIDIVFSTAADVEDAVAVQSGQSNEESGGDDKPKQARTPAEELEAKRQSAALAFGTKQGLVFVKQRRALYATSDEKIRMCVAVSKTYGNRYQPYWYAYHPHWDEFLQKGHKAYLILVCMDRDVAYAIPHGVFSQLLPKLNKTNRPDRYYWHIAVTTLDDNSLAINISSVGERLPLLEYEYPLAKQKLP